MRLSSCREFVVGKSTQAERGRQGSGPPGQLRRQLLLEPLEDRCVLSSTGGSSLGPLLDLFQLQSAPQRVIGPVLVAYQHVALESDLVTFTSPTPELVHASIQLAGNSPTASQITPNGDGSFSVRGSFLFDQVGSFLGTVALSAPRWAQVNVLAPPSQGAPTRTSPPPGDVTGGSHLGPNMGSQPPSGSSNDPATDRLSGYCPVTECPAPADGSGSGGTNHVTATGSGVPNEVKRNVPFVVVVLPQPTSFSGTVSSTGPPAFFGSGFGGALPLQDFSYPVADTTGQVFWVWFLQPRVPAGSPGLEQTPPNQARTLGGPVTNKGTSSQYLSSPHPSDDFRLHIPYDQALGRDLDSGNRMMGPTQQPAPPQPNHPEPIIRSASEERHDLLRAAAPPRKEPDDKGLALVAPLPNKRREEDVLAERMASDTFFGQLTPEEENETATLLARKETKEMQRDRLHYELVLLLVFFSVFLRDLRG
jgi:hypothetical protein